MPKGISAKKLQQQVDIIQKFILVLIALSFKKSMTMDDVFNLFLLLQIIAAFD